MICVLVIFQATPTEVFTRLDPPSHCYCYDSCPSFALSDHLCRPWPSPDLISQISPSTWRSIGTSLVSFDVPVIRISFSDALCHCTSQKVQNSARIWRRHDRKRDEVRKIAKRQRNQRVTMRCRSVGYL